MRLPSIRAKALLRAHVTGAVAPWESPEELRTEGSGKFHVTNHFAVLHQPIDSAPNGSHGGKPPTIAPVRPITPKPPPQKIDGRSVGKPKLIKRLPMGRQVQFYMLLEDCAAFLRHVQEHDPVIV